MSLFKSQEKRAEESAGFVQALLLPNENLLNLYQIGAEFIALTNRRAIVKDLNGVFDSTYGVTSIVYSKITAVSFDQAVSSFAKVMPTLKICAPGIELKLKGFNQDTVREAYDNLLSKII